MGSSSHPFPRSMPNCQFFLRFSVRDTGIGISEEGQKKLFQSFSQVDASTTRNYGGTGLGLAICKQLVQLMGGEIGVDSAEGEGSNFWFSAELSAAEAEVNHERQADSLSSNSQGAILNAKKLLVVDDHPTNRKVLGLQATAWGMQVDEADRAEAALTALASAAREGTPYHVAILDWQMPDKSGEALGELIRNSSELTETKLVLMTSLDNGDIATRIRTNFEGYLVKPVKESKLYDCLVATLSEQDTVLDTVVAAAKEAREPEAPTPVSPAELSYVKILMVEDTPVNQKVVLNQLQLIGYQADCVNNGQEALDVLAQRDYHIVLMDCQMPVLDGYKATRQLREREQEREREREREREQEGEQKRTTVIGLTAYAMKGDREKCLAAGMDDYLSKPVSIEDLERVLGQWLPQHSLELSGDNLETRQEPRLSALNPPIETQSSEFEVPVDLERLDKIAGGDAEFQREILQSFLEDAELDLAAGKAALAANDQETLGLLAHRLKGGSATAAVRFMPEVAAELDRLCKENKGYDFLAASNSSAEQTFLENPLVRATKLLAQLESILERLKAYVTARFSYTDTTALAQAPPTLTYPDADTARDGGVTDVMDGGVTDVMDGVTDVMDGGVTDVMDGVTDVMDGLTIDVEYLKAIAGGDAEFQQELLQAFVEDAEIDLAGAKAAIAVSDFEALVEKARSLFGGAETLAVRSIPQLAASLEQVALENQLERAAELLDSIEETLERVKADIARVA